MPVDYAEVQRIQTLPLNIEPGVRESPLPVPITPQPAPPPPPQPAPPPPPPRPEIPRPQPRAIVPSPPTAPLPIPDTLPAPPAPRTRQIPAIRNNRVYVPRAGNNFARDEAFEQAAYYLGFFIHGFSDGIIGKNVRNESLRLKRWEEEELAYEEGRKTGGGTIQAIKEINKTRENLWRNRPKFEIPDIKLPKLPELPEIELPKIPEFKFPEIVFPKPKTPPQREPKPQPPDPYKRENQEKLVRDSEQHQCGDTYFTVIYCRLVTGFRNQGNPDGSTSVFRIYEPGSVDGFSKSAKDYLLDRGIPETDLYYKDPIYYITSGSGFGQSEIIYKGSQPNFYIIPKGGQTLSKNVTNWWNLELPFWETYHADVRVYPGGSASEALDYIDDGYKVLVTNFHTTSQKQGCVVPRPEPESPPPEPKEKCCMCCPANEKINYAIIKQMMVASLKEQKFTIQIPIITCEFNETKKEWEPKTTNTSLEFFATSQQQAQQLAQLHLDNAKQFSDLCLARNQESDGEAIAAIPLSWQIRHEGGKPQMVIQCAEITTGEDGKRKYGSAMYPITVPHWKGKANDKPSLPAYKKGNWEGILVLKDNTKVTINAANEAEATKILNAIKPWIQKEMLEGSYFKGGKINSDIKATQVKPMYGRYFSTGQKNSKPDWRVDFP